MPGWIGFPELLVLLIVVLLVFGPKRLPEMGRSLGKGMREFKDSITGNDEKTTAAPPQLPPPAEVPVAPTAPSREHDTTTPAP
jgi:sec-independent protein translocase protein TatA